MLEILDPGMLATVQDAVGRREWRRFGVPLGGAADAWSARLANRLVGNADDRAVLEVVGSASVAFDAPAIVAVAGGLAASIGGIPMSPDSARRVPAGSQVRVGAAADTGLRGYVAVAGGLDVEPVLGSRSTDLRTGFGGLDGRQLRAGDRIPIGRAGASASVHRWSGTRDDGPLRILGGPQGSRATMGALTGPTWRVAGAVDRTGIRLEGPPLAHGGEVPSQGLLPGAIQVPPGGSPILMLADCPVTGGYVVAACVIGADVGRAAQLRPGNPVSFLEVGHTEARAAWLRLEAELEAVEALEATRDGDPGWAGSHA